jgi:peptide/nickel transport system permease protein
VSQAALAVNERDERHRTKLLKSLLRHPPSAVAIGVLTAYVVAAALAPAVAPHSPTAQSLGARLLPPLGHSSAWTGSPPLLGTDSLGRDELSRLIFGARTSLEVTFVSVTIAGILGLVVGAIAGFYGGVVDRIVELITTIQLGYPYLLLAITFLAFAPPGLTTVIIVMVVTTWAYYTRVVRAATLTVKQQTYIEAAVAIGNRRSRIILQHVVRNVMGPFLVVATVQGARVVILAATLNFLGLGVPPPTPTWGGMLATGRDYVDTAWWLETFPGIAIMVFVLSLNILGDRLRDYFDPRAFTG